MKKEKYIVVCGRLEVFTEHVNRKIEQGYIPLVNGVFVEKVLDEAFWYQAMVIKEIIIDMTIFKNTETIKTTEN